jgi:hypothetical protein
MYNGRYGNLSSGDAAQKSLQDIANNYTWDDLNRANNDKATTADRYDSGRLLRMIEGLQMVLAKNGGTAPVTWLPVLYKIEHETPRVVVKDVTSTGKMLTYATKDD